MSWHPQHHCIPTDRNRQPAMAALHAPRLAVAGASVPIGREPDPTPARWALRTDGGTTRSPLRTTSSGNMPSLVRAPRRPLQCSPLFLSVFICTLTCAGAAEAAITLPDHAVVSRVVPHVLPAHPAAAPILLWLPAVSAASRTLGVHAPAGHAAGAAQEPVLLLH